MLNDSPTDRRTRKRRNTDPHKHKRDSNPPLRIVITREIPNGRIIQPLHGAGEEAVEARNDDNSGVAFGADPDEQKDAGEEDAGDDGVDVAEVAVREEGREQATWEVGGVHEDQEGYGRVAVELEVGLGVGDDEVEAEIDAPEGEEETWELALIWFWEEEIQYKVFVKYHQDYD